MKNDYPVIPVGPQRAGAESVAVGVCSTCYALAQQHRPATNEMMMALLCQRCKAACTVALKHPKPGLGGVTAFGMCKPCHDKMEAAAKTGRPSPDLLCGPCRAHFDEKMATLKGFVSAVSPS